MSLSLIVVILNLAGGENTPLALVILSTIASLILSYVLLSVALAAVDNHSDLLRFSQIRKHFPTFRQFFMLIGVGIATGFFVVLGFIALIIPGIYIMIRFMFTNLAYVDRKGRVMQTLRYSWHLVKGDVFWTVFLTVLVSFGLMLLGILLLGVGFLVTYPLSMLLIAKLYRALTLHHEEQSLIVQPEELPSPETSA